jgi:hypothetical protein
MNAGLTGGEPTPDNSMIAVEETLSSTKKPTSTVNDEGL